MLLHESIRTAHNKYVVNKQLSLKMLLRIAALDPTPTKKYVEILCDAYLNKIDLEYARQTIIKFDVLTIKNLIQGNEKDISNKIFHDVELIVLNHEQSQSKTEIKKKIGSNILRIYEDKTWLIIVPLTIEAAIKYGKGTKWCISALKNNRFYSYISGQRAIFYFIFDQINNEKYAVSIGNRGKTWYDSANEVIAPMILPVWLKFDNEIFNDIVNQSLASQLAIVNRNSAMIQYVKNPNEEVQIAAVKQAGNAIQYIENPSEATQLVAVKLDGDAIQFIKNPSQAVTSQARQSTRRTQ